MEQLSLVEFAKKYIKIKTHKGAVDFNDIDLELLEVIDKAMTNGYDLKMIKDRKGSRIVFVKK